MAKDFNFIEEDNLPVGGQKNRQASRVSESKMVNFLIRKGIAKSEGQANLILIVMIVVCISFIVYFNFSGSDEPEVSATDPTAMPPL